MIKKVGTIILGIAFGPAGYDEGAISAEEAMDTVSKAAANYDEIQVYPLKSNFNERGILTSVLNQYVFIKYVEEAPAKSKKDA